MPFCAADTQRARKFCMYFLCSLCVSAINPHEAGKKDQARLLHFLDQHAASMPRTMLCYATEKPDTKHG